MHAITNAVLPGELVFDIGANAGDKTAWFASKGIRVVAIEPQPRLADHLRKRFADNANVTIVQKGVSDEMGQLEISISSDSRFSTFSEDWKNGRFKGQMAWNERASVEVTTLDELIREYGLPRYAKIDVEGFERQVISGLSRKVGCLSFEFCAEMVADTMSVCSRLNDLGYKYFNMSFGESDDYAVPDRWLTAEDVSLRLQALAHQDALVWGDVYAA